MSRILPARAALVMLALSAPACLEDEETADAATARPDAPATPRPDAEADGGTITRDDAEPELDGGPMNPDANPDAGPTTVCTLAVRPARLGFGAVEHGRRAVLPVSLENSGGAACDLSGVTVTGRGLALLGAAPTTVAPGSVAIVDVAYDAAQAGPTDGELTVSERGAAPQTVAITGTATTAIVRALPETAHFESSALDCTTRRDLTITADRRGARVTEVRLDDGSHPAFSVDGSLFPTTVSPDGSVVVSVDFLPTAAKQAAARLLVYGEGRAEPSVVGLWGSGSADPQVAETFPPLRSKVDVLLVVDDSPSMVEEHAALAGAATTLITRLGVGSVDYRIGLVTTDVARRGALTEIGRRRWIDATDPDPAAAIGAALTAIGTSGTGTEAGLESMFLALTAPAITGPNAGFVRADANLAVVVLTDEEDFSPRQIAVYRHFLGSLKPRDRQLTATFSAMIVLPSDNVSCAGSGASVGLRYLDMVNETGGSIGSICAADWTRALSPIANVLAGQRVFFPVRGTPETGTIEVSVDGAPVTTGWSWTAAVRAVRFQAPASPPPNATIEIRYAPRCQ